MSSPNENTNGSITGSSNACNSKGRRRNKRLKKRDAEFDGSRSDNANNPDTDGEVTSTEKEDDFAYTGPKPQAITGGLFMWEEVASFCEPRQVCELERLCRDVAAHLAASNTGTRLMQRYWNAQWTRMVWQDEHLPREKSLVLSSSLPRSKGKLSWKKCFSEEYPLWLQRTIMGKGNNDRAYDASKVLFRREVLNTHMSGDELAAMELTVDEAMHKAMAKRGIEIGKDGEGDPKALLEDQKQIKYSMKRRGEIGAGASGTASPLLRKGLSSLDLCLRTSQGNLTREDYQFDHRQGTRKGKHKKGLEKKWSSYDNFGDYDY